MPAYKLLLHAANPHCPPAGLDTLARRLTELGLIGARIRHPTETLYSGGERLPELVTFLGCAPHIDLHPPESPEELEAAIASGGFCHVRLAQSDTLRFRTDGNAPLPALSRMPATGTQLAAAPERLAIRSGQAALAMPGMPPTRPANGAELS